MAGALKDDEVADQAMRVLRASLAVEPPAGFDDRVRAAISARQGARRPRYAPWLAAAAVLLAAAGVAAVRSLRPPAPRLRVESTPPAATARATVSESDPLPTAAAPVSAPVRTTASRSVAAVRRAAAGGHTRPGPFSRDARPLVPEDEAARIVRYAALVRRHPHDGESLPILDASVPLARPAAIAIVPLEVVPIGNEEGSLR
jgi:hypothetical protein